MPNYGRYGGPENYYQGGGDGSFDPYTGRLNVGQLIQQFILRKRAEEEQKKQAQWDVEDRELNKRVKEAQIRNYDEVAPAKVEKPTSKVSPVQVKSMMKRLQYPDEAVAEVDTMNEVALKDTWAKLQDHFRQITSSGGRVPATAQTAKGRLQYQKLKSALDVVKSRKNRYNAALSQLYAYPERGAFAQGQIAEYEKTLDDIEMQEGEIASMMNNIDETGELTEQQFIQLNTILKFKKSYAPRPKAKEQTEAEKKLPPGFTIK